MPKKLQNFNLFDKILKRIFPIYTNKVYRIGVKDGFNWNCEFLVEHIKDGKRT